jgi:hypothetical protein
VELEEIKKRRTEMSDTERAAYDLGISAVEQELTKIRERNSNKEYPGEARRIVKALLQTVSYLQQHCAELRGIEPVLTPLMRLLDGQVVVLPSLIEEGLDSPRSKLYSRYQGEVRACAADHPDWTPAQLADPILDRLQVEMGMEEARPGELVGLLEQLRSSVPRE